MSTATASSYGSTPSTEEHAMFYKTVRKSVENEIAPYAEEWEAAGIAPLHDIFKKKDSFCERV